MKEAALVIVASFIALLVVRSLMVDAAPDFSEFVHMTSSAEACSWAETDCKIQASRFDGNIRVAVDPGRNNAILNEAQKRLPELVEVISLGANIPIRYSDQDPNVLVLLMDEETKFNLAAGLIPLIDEAFIEKYDELGWSKGRCSARAFIEETTNDFGKIRGALIFISEKISIESVMRCVSEELVNILGLFNDPEGYASLFQSPNHAVSSDQYLTDQTLGYLEYLYSTDMVDENTWASFWEDRSLSK